MADIEQLILQGQTAIVTGASSGIGAAVAIALSEAGANVGVNYRGNPQGAERIVREMKAQGRRAIAVRADVSQESEVRDMFAEVVGAFGRLDILVANAGLQQDAPITGMTLEQWNRVLAVNLTGQFLCAQAAIRQFLQQPPSSVSKARGKVICMSSVHEIIPWAGHVNYAASKGGVMLMMKSLAQEVAEKGIRVNSIAPGAIKTPINQDVWTDAEQSRQLLELIPYGRLGEPEDVARAAVWLASDQSDYVVGTSLLIDGGMSLYPEFRGSG